MAIPLVIGDANRRWWVLGATGGSLAIVLLDEVVVGVALPTIRDDLGMSQLASHWIVNAYMLALTAFVAAGGRLGDVIGHRPVFIGGAVVFGAASLASGLAASGEWLLASRAAQGAGAAALWSTGVAMTGMVFPAGERGRAFAYYTLGGTAAMLVGPFVGGLLTEFASWRWIFFLNLPVAAGVVWVTVAAWREPPETATDRPSFDLPGLTSLSAVLLPLVLALMQAPDWGWGSPAVIVLLAAAAAALPVFLLVESRVSEPLIDIELFRRPTVVGANLVLLAAQFSKIAMIVFGALFLQDKIGMSPFEAGVAILAALAPVALTIRRAGRMTDEIGSRLPTLVGTATMTAGLAWVAIFASQESYPLLLPGLVLWGLSLPFFFTPPRAAVLDIVPLDKHGEAGGVLTTAQMLGGTLGVSLLGAVLVDSGSYSALFGLAAAVTAGAWCATFFLIDHVKTAAKRSIAHWPADNVGRATGGGPRG
ncbi:MAG: MFS transporter [Solirubrobacterales bacterium]|nr:MFS transporter [Solirubrobacterales bacterium]